MPKIDPVEKQERVRIEVSQDHSNASIQFLPPSGASGSMTVNADQLLALIQILGQARSEMVAGQPILPLEGIEIKAIFNTRWYIEPESLTEGSLLSFYHPAFGPVGFLIPREQVPEIVRLLTAHLGIKPQSQTQKPN